MPETSEKTDQALLDDFVRHGLDCAFAELARRYQGMAFAAAYRICGDRGEAQDILQQALIVLARRAGTLGEVRCLSAWLHRVVVLEATKARRKTNRRRLRETMAYQMHASSLETSDSPVKIAPELDRSLNAMGAKDREVLTLHYLEGHTFKAIQQRLGGTAESWQKRSVRALQKLADQLRRRGVAVSAVALGAFLAGTRAEAGVTASLLETVTRHAIEQGTGDAVGISAKAAILLTMKTGIAISLTSGVLLAYGWGVVVRPAIWKPASGPVIISAPSGSGIESAQRARRDNGFTMEMVKQAVSGYEVAAGQDPLVESRLRSLMFLVPEKYLEETLQILLATKDHGKFQQVVAALFGAWAEHDPVAALARAREAGDFSYQARRAVMVTWLNQDSEAALAVMLADKSKEHREFLTEFVTYQCERKPQDAALLVDRVAKDWPEVDRPLFERVANLWSRSDALAAGDWVASYSDEEVKEKLLRSIAVDVAKLRGFDGLAIANHIEDSEIRREARNDAVYWWAVMTGGHSLIPGTARPVRDLSGGFPDDWTDENIRTFAQATMVNYTKNLPDLLKIAKDDGQRILICEGAVKGSAWSNPAAVTDAAEQLPDSFAETPQGKETLKVFIQRWSEMDSRAADVWLSKQAPGPKTELMRGALKKEGPK
jgi:RNA polymerase sigma factor (sigma-70 family)